MDAFDLRSLSYVEPVNANLLCCICQTPFDEPVVVEPCGHIFCRTCITQAIAVKPNCPVDRALLTSNGTDLRPAPKIVANMVNELAVGCPNSSDGCSHVGQRQLVRHHVKEECPYTRVTCTVDGCDEIVHRKDLARHVETCQTKMILCSKCNEEAREMCPEQNTACPHGRRRHSRSLHTKHLDKCCETIISCVHAEHGCTWSGQRCDLADVHLPVCPYEPLKEFFAQYRQRVEELERENRQLRTDLATAVESLQELCEAKDRLGLDSLLGENRRLQDDVQSLNAGLTDLELRQNAALMTQSLGMQEELQDLRALCYDLQIQIDHLRCKGSGNEDGVSGGGSSGSDRSVSAVASALESKSAAAMRSVMHNWRLSNAVVELAGRSDRQVGFGLQDTGRQHTKL